MAKLTLTLTLIPSLALFLVFSLADSLPTYDVHGREVLPLPSYKPRAVQDTESHDAVADPKSAIAEPEPEHEGFVSVPLTKLDFHEGSVPLPLRFAHRRYFSRGCRHGFMRRHGMRPREISHGNDMILSDRDEEFVGRSRFHWVNRWPRFEVSPPWKGEEDVFKKPKKFEGGFDEEDRVTRPKRFLHHEMDEDDVFRRPKKFHHDNEDHVFEIVNKLKHGIFRTPRKFMHHDDDDDDNEWHKGKHHHRHHHKHHHEDDEEDGLHEHGKHRHHDDDEDDKSGILSKMRKLFDDLF